MWETKCVYPAKTEEDIWLEAANSALKGGKDPGPAVHAANTVVKRWKQRFVEEEVAKRDGE